jgi:hypothetical protein
VTVQMMTQDEYDKYFSTAIVGGTGLNRAGTVTMPMINRHTSATCYDALGQKMTGMSGRVNVSGQHSVMFNAADQASGVYFSLPE